MIIPPGIFRLNIPPWDLTPEDPSPEGYFGDPPGSPLCGLRLVVLGGFTCLIRTFACLFFPERENSDPDGRISAYHEPGYVSLQVSLDGQTRKGKGDTIPCNGDESARTGQDPAGDTRNKGMNCPCFTVRLYAVFQPALHKKKGTFLFLKNLSKLFSVSLNSANFQSVSQKYPLHNQSPCSHTSYNCMSEEPETPARFQKSRWARRETIVFL